MLIGGVIVDCKVRVGGRRCVVWAARQNDDLASPVSRSAPPAHKLLPRSPLQKYCNHNSAKCPRTYKGNHFHTDNTSSCALQMQAVFQRLRTFVEQNQMLTSELNHCYSLPLKTAAQNQTVLWVAINLKYFFLSRLKCSLLAINIIRLTSWMQTRDRDSFVSPPDIAGQYNQSSWRC